MPSELPQTKDCTTCGHTRPVALFLPSPLTDDALTDRCRPCIWAAEHDRAEARGTIGAIEEGSGPGTEGH